MCSQVACHRFDPDARWKSWDSVFISASYRSIGVGSTRDKALARALSEPLTPDQARKVLPLAGCSVRAVPEHRDRKHAMVISIPGVGDSVFAFDDSATRDAFIQRLQVQWLPVIFCV